MGRKKQYVKLEYDLLYSHSWQNLSLAARDAYVQVKAARNLKNSRGKIINRTDDFIRFGFADSSGMSKPTYYKAIMDLEAAGMILTVEKGQFPGKKSAYALIDEWRQQEKYLKRVQWD